MTLGHELGRAYVNTVTCLADGTLVSGNDAGRIQWWRHGERLREAIHHPHGPALLSIEAPLAVTCLAPLSEGSGFGVASGGDGCTRLWTEGGECAACLPAPPGMRPVQLAALPSGLAAVFRQVRTSLPTACRPSPTN